jgi:hypothetical protein
MRSNEDIVSLYLERRRSLIGLHTQMAKIRAIYTGDVQVALPDMDANKDPSVPNLLQTGVDQMAARVASVMPEVWFSPAKDNRPENRKASTRRKVIGGWWQSDNVSTKLKYRARNLLAYSMAPATIHYDPKKQRPTWNVRDPLQAFPSTDAIAGEVTPHNIIFAYTRTLGWLIANGYPEVRAMMLPSATSENEVTLLEYIDDEATTLIAYLEAGQHGWSAGSPTATRLEFVPHPAGIVPATNPSRISLEQSGQFDGMTGMYYQQAKLMALEVMAVEKGIFPDTYLEGRAGEIPRFIHGPVDGRTGEVNIVTGGNVRTENPQPGYLTNGTIDRLERSQRLTAGIPAEFGGESPSNVRTGRRGDSVLSATIDFPVAEAQEILALALHDENTAAIKLARFYDGMEPRTIYVGTGNSASAVTYISEKVFDDHCEHSVSFPISGADLNALMIGMGQRVGMGLMSKKTAAQLDPYIADAESEHDNIISEGLEQALLSGFQQQAASGSIPPLVIAKVMELVKTDRMELAAAINKVTEDAAAAAAEEAAAAQEQQSLDQMAAGPTMESLAGASPIPGASPGQEDLASMMATLRMPAMTTQPMRGVSEGAI